MRRWLRVAGLAVALLALALAEANLNRAEQTPRAENDVVGLVRDWLSAESRNDRATMDRIVADDFFGTAFGGNIVTKPDILPPEGGGERGWPKSVLRESTARMFGTTGVVMGRVAVEDPERPGEFRFTIVCIKGQRGWQMVAAHLSRISPEK